MIIKVCGLKDQRQVEIIDDLVDFVGFIYYEKSKRKIDHAPLSSKAERVGVFVNSSVDTIVNKISEDQLDIIQLHGDESPEYIKNINTELKIIKAFGVDEKFDFRKLVAYENVVDYFLFDTKCESYGGSGEQFEWTSLNRYNLTTPFLLAGGISLSSITALKQIEHPLFAGVDLNSRFEISPGNKNIELLKTFVDEYRND